MSQQNERESRQMRSLGILGYGNFGQFVASYLDGHFKVCVADRLRPDPLLVRAPIEAVDIGEAAGCDIVVLAVPVQAMEALVVSVRNQFRKGALIVEVASVKERPAEILDRCLPPENRFLGLHPMFGPQSGKHGIDGLKVVLSRPTSSQRCATRTQCAAVARFLETLNLEVLEMSARDHDREIAYIQGLTHWIAKALREIRLPDLQMATPAYRHLLKIEEILRDDSAELFRTIQSENDFSRVARAEFYQRLKEIERAL